MLAISAILPYIPSMIAAGKDLWSFVFKVREAAKQTGEWTPKLEEAFSKAIMDAAQKDYWKPETS